MPKTYECEACSFSSTLRQNYEKHLRSVKHNEAQNIKLSITEIAPQAKSNDLELLKLAFEQKITELDHKYEVLKLTFEQKLKDNDMKHELKLAALENKFLEYRLSQQSMVQPVIQQVIKAPVVEKQKILPITYIKTQMTDATTIKKTIDDKYENGMDIHGLADIITMNDVDRIVKSTYLEGIKPILNKIVYKAGGLSKFKIVCVDRHRKRFFTHIEKNGICEWTDDEYGKEIKLFLNCINYMLIKRYMEWTKKYNNDSLIDLQRISGAMEEGHENNCYKKLIVICSEMFCIGNMVDDFNNGIKSVPENIIIEEDQPLIPNERDE